MTQKLKKLGFRGYIFQEKLMETLFLKSSKSCYKRLLPKKKPFFKLSATEYKMEHCYLMLNSVLKDLKNKWNVFTVYLYLE